jgi:ABC-type antimicrobial peptide transport system permease subunit
VLALVGLYGLMSYTVARRREEFGVRMALGASPAGLQRLVMRDSLLLVGAGLVVGLAASALTVGRLTPMLFGLEPLDPIVFTATAILLLVCAVLAAYLPARRLTRLNAVAALRVTS